MLFLLFLLLFHKYLLLLKKSLVALIKQPKVLAKQEEFFFMFYCVSVIPPINTFESSYDFMILIISFISSFEINKVNPFPALTASVPLIFLSNLFITFEIKLLTNPGKFSVAKEIATFVSTFLSKLTNQ